MTFYSTPQGKTLHTIDPEKTSHTFCSRLTRRAGTKHEINPRTLRPCQQCRREAMRRLIFPYESPYEITRAVVEKSLGIDGRMVVEIPGPRVFIVEGSGGVYVVTLAPGLNPLCTCLAGKTKPELACKHVLKVLTINREEAA